jgi:hypothetical protein
MATIVDGEYFMFNLTNGREYREVKLSIADIKEIIEEIQNEPAAYRINDDSNPEWELWAKIQKNICAR